MLILDEIDVISYVMSILQAQRTRTAILNRWND